MRLAETKVYSFSELSEDAKQKAIEYFRQNDDMPFLSEDLCEYLGETLAKHKITYDDAPQLFYSLSYSQGDGAMFTGVVKYKSWRITIEHYGHYYHFNSKQITDIVSIKTGETPNDKTWSRVFNEFEPLYVDICKDLEKYGYDYIESQTSDEAISETIEANDYEFTEDGKLW